MEHVRIRFDFKKSHKEILENIIKKLREKYDIWTMWEGYSFDKKDERMTLTINTKIDITRDQFIAALGYAYGFAVYRDIVTPAMQDNLQLLTPFI